MLLESLVNHESSRMVEDHNLISDAASQSSEHTTPQIHQWDDVFESDSHHPTITSNSTSNDHATLIDGAAFREHATSHDFLTQTSESYANDIVSDYERLRSTHATAGYRDGISVGKAVSIQTGFDEGFALGGEIGRAVGYLIGSIQGLAAALNDDEDVNEVLRSVKQDLRLESVLASEYISEEGLWKYEVQGEEQGEVIFEQVAWAHPLVSKWKAQLELLLKERGVDVGVLKRQMGDAEEQEEMDDFATEIR